MRAAVGNYRRPIRSLLWVLAGIATFWAFGFARLSGTDLWWHLAAGRWIWQHKSFPAQDPFSFSAHQKWVIDSWLSDVVLYQWSQLFGLYSLVYWKWTLIVAIFLLLAKVNRRISHDQVAGFLAAIFAAAVAQPFLDIRPHLFSLLFIVLLLLIMSGDERASRWRFLLIPALFLIWANFHAGVVLGVLLLPFLLARDYLEAAKRNAAIALTAVAWLATLANPNGISVYRQSLVYALRAQSPFSARIAEWQGPFVPGGIVSPLYRVALPLFATSAVLLLCRKSRKRFLPLIAVGAVTMLMSLQSRRLIPAFAICAAPTLAAVLAPFSRRLVMKLPFFAIPVVITCIAAFVLLRYPLRPRAFHHLTVEYTFPVESVNFIETNGLRGNIFAYYNWGGYLHWRIPGQMKVFIDARASALFDQATFRDYVKIFAVEPGWESVMERLPVEYVLWPTGEEPIYNSLLKNGRWRFVYGDAVSVLIARSETSLGPLHDTPDSAYKDLALGLVAMDHRAWPEAESFFRHALLEMPYLEPACSRLAFVRIKQGATEEGERILRQCDAIFPDSERRKRVGQMLER
jgi:hypothetical protein